jgi:serine/threonine protein kinase
MKSSKGGIVDERYTKLIIRELLTALSFLHRNNIIHRDIKGEFPRAESPVPDRIQIDDRLTIAANVLLTSDGRILLCDFGVSALMATPYSKRTTFVGTPYWMAPEVINSGSQYDTKADIWSLGITIYEMVMGSPPHANQEAMRVLVLIPKVKPPRLPETLGTLDMREFVASVLRELPVDVSLVSNAI